MTDMSTTLLAITCRSSLPRSRSSATISSMYSACMSCLQPEKTLSLSTSPSPHLRKETLKQWFMSSTTLKLWLKTLAFLLHSLQNRFDSLRNSPMSRISSSIPSTKKFANESNFFVDGIDEETMDGFFKCALDESLVVVNMRQVLQLLYALSIEKMIPHNWVSLIADNQLLTPKSTGKASKRGAISSRLSELKASSAKFPSGEFLDFAKQLKEMR